MTAWMRILGIFLLCLGTAVPPRLHMAETHGPAHDHAMLAGAAAHVSPCHDDGGVPQRGERDLSHVACMLACACLPAQPVRFAAMSIAQAGARLMIASDRKPASAIPDPHYRPPAST